MHARDSIPLPDKAYSYSYRHSAEGNYARETDRKASSGSLLGARFSTSALVDVGLKAKPGAASVQSFWKERLGFAVGTPWG